MQKKHPVRFFAAAFAVAVPLLLATAQVASALTLPLTLGERARLATTISVVTVDARRVGMDGDDVITQVQTQPSKALKGAAPRTVELQGGRLGNVTEKVSDQPALVPGRTYLVFLDEQGRPIGGPQGAVEVRDGLLYPSGTSLAEVLGAFETGQDRNSTAAERRRAASTLATTLAGAVGPQAVATTGSALTVGNASVSAEEAPAGTNTIVEINGTGFGSTPGRVAFTYGGTTPMWGAGPISWSSTRIRVAVPIFDDTTVQPPYPGAASSGPLYITTAGGTGITTSALGVTYAFDGNKWFAPMKLWVNSSGTALSASAAYAFVAAGADAWAQAGFPMSVEQTTVPYSDATSADDGFTTLYWDPTLPDGILGWTAWKSVNGQVLEADIAFNSSLTWTNSLGQQRPYLWGDLLNTADPAHTLDIQTIAMHEIGHLVALRDQYGLADRGDTMYGEWSPSTGVKRVLQQAEKDGVAYIYGTDRTPPSVSASLSGRLPVVGSGGIAWTRGEATLTVVPGEANVRWLRYRLNNSASASATAPVRIPLVDGVHDVTYWAVDSVGNASTPRHALIGIDRGSAVNRPATRIVGTRTYRISAFLNRRHAAGSSPVRMQFWRKNSRGVYVYYGSAKAKAYSVTGGSSARVTYRFRSKGDYIVRAYHADGLHMPMLSAARRIVVR